MRDLYLAIVVTLWAALLLWARDSANDKHPVLAAWQICCAACMAWVVITVARA